MGGGTMGGRGNLPSLPPPRPGPSALLLLPLCVAVTAAVDAELLFEILPSPVSSSSIGRFLFVAASTPAVGGDSVIMVSQSHEDCVNVGQ